MKHTHPTHVCNTATHTHPYRQTGHWSAVSSAYNIIIRLAYTNANIFFFSISWLIMKRVLLNAYTRKQAYIRWDGDPYRMHTCRVHRRQQVEKMDRLHETCVEWNNNNDTKYNTTNRRTDRDMKRGLFSHHRFSFFWSHEATKTTNIVYKNEIK